MERSKRLQRSQKRKSLSVSRLTDEPHVDAQIPSDRRKPWEKDRRKDTSSKIHDDHKKRASDLRNSSKHDSEHHGNGSLRIRPYTDRKFSNTYHELGIQRRYMDYFAQNVETTKPSSVAERILKFYNELCMSLDSTRQTTIRLKDSEFGTDRTREYPQYLDIDQFREALERDRIGLTDHPDANCRQMFIEHINKDVFRILAETVTCHELEPLRHALAGHNSRKNSVSVYQSEHGFNVPRLEFHLPYLALRKCTNSGVGELLGEQWKPWIFPLSTQGSQDPQPENLQVIYKAHISIVISIWDRSTWTGYAFSEPCPNHNRETNDDKIDSGHDDDELANESETGEEGDLEIHVDPAHDLFDPDDDVPFDPVERDIDPRIYFLRIVEIWIKRAVQEYTYLVDNIEDNMSDWRDHGLGRAFGALQGGHLDRKALMSARRTLAEVRRHAKTTIRVWKSFNDSEQKAFFFELDHHAIRSTRDKIKVSYDELIDLEQRLAPWEMVCKFLLEELQLDLNWQSNELSRNAHHLNLKTNVISHEIQKLNRTSTEAAIKTRRITEVSVHLFWVTTPFVLVLQYFGADRPIFKFQRNEKTFAIALVIISLMLPLVIYVIDFVNNGYMNVYDRLIGKKKKDVLNDMDAAEVA